MRRVLGVAVLLGFGLSASAHADGVAVVVDEVTRIIDRGDAAAATSELARDAVRADLTRQPEHVRALCERATLSRARFDACELADRKALAKSLWGLAVGCLEAQPSAPDSLRAVAHALVLCERSGVDSWPSPWWKAADLLSGGAMADLDDGEPVADAVSFLLEGACAPDAEVHRLTKRAGSLAKLALERHAGVVPLATRMAAAQFRTARELLATRRKDAKAAVRSGLEYLRPHTGGDVPDRWVATLWNDAVTFGRTSEFVLREKYLTVREDAADGRVTFALPVSHWWSITTVELENPEQSYRYVSVVAPDGAPLRQVIFRKYDWTLRYSLDGSNEVNGDNVKKLAQGLQAMTARNVFEPGAVLSKPRKGRVNTELDGYTFDIRGVAAQDRQPLRVWCGFFRGKRQTSYALVVYDFTDAEDFDPSMQAFVESLREVER